MSRDNTDNAGSITSRLGEIVDRDRLAGRDVFAVRVVVVTICYAHRPKTEYPTRWPGKWRAVE